VKTQHMATIHIIYDKSKRRNYILVHFCKYWSIFDGS